MKSIIRKVLKESEHLKGLFGGLPLFLRRRLTMEDLEWLDRELVDQISGMPPRDDFDMFADDVLGDLLHEFVVHRKDDEIETEEDPHYGLIYSEGGFDKVASIYWELIPYLKKRYEIKLRRAWEGKKSR